MTPRLLTTAEAAQRLGCRSDHVLSLIRAGALPATDIAARRGRPLWRVAETDLMEFVAGRASRRPQPRQAPRRKLPRVRQWS